MTALKIYLATSWKMEETARQVAAVLRKDGHEVDCFCDASTGRYVFHWSEFVGREEDLRDWDAISFLNTPQALKAFKEDKKWLDWCDVLIMIRSCGNSAHLEAGYAKGCSKKLYIYGDFPPGEFDVMYGFADGLFRWAELDDLRTELKDLLVKV